jgi:hypothetical protein
MHCALRRVIEWAAANAVPRPCKAEPAISRAGVVQDQLAKAAGAWCGLLRKGRHLGSGAASALADLKLVRDLHAANGRLWECRITSDEAGRRAALGTGRLNE